MKKFKFFLFFVFYNFILEAQNIPLEEFQRVMEKIIEGINSEKYEIIQEEFGSEMQEALPLEKTEAIFKALIEQYGKAKNVEPIRFIPPNQGVFPTHFEKNIFDIKIVLNNQGKIIGLWIMPHTPSIPIPEKNETKLYLPFKGKWYVFWGGDTKELNQHNPVPNQRYAFDFLIIDKGGKSFKGEGKKNEDYYVFGKEILAPADGIVTDVINGVRDNKPGSMNPYSALGNAVFIKHSEYEISVLAHLKYGSIKVKVGDKVKRGHLIGLCGNSGNSSEPHLHYHLQNTPIIQDGNGIKVYFEKIYVIRDGVKELKEKYSPIKGEEIEAE